MYEIYQKLLDEKGLKNSDVARGAKVSNMTLSDWKRGETTPKTQTMQKIADFLEVSVDYLMTGEKAIAPKPITAKEHIEIISLYERLSDEQKTAIKNLLVSMVK